MSRSTSTNQPTPSPHSNHLKRWVFGLTVFGVVTLIALTGGVYFAYNYIRESIQSTPLTIPIFDAEPTLNQVAFVGNDDNVWLVSPSGQNLRRITNDSQRYRFPTWSPNGNHLAFLGQDSEDNTGLYISPTQRSDPRLVFQENTAAPFYLYWAPDSQAITFLTQEASSLALRLIDLRKPEIDRILERGSPLYWVWSPVGSQLLMHVGGARSSTNHAYISLLDNQKEVQRKELDVTPGRFQAPVWTSNGDELFYVLQEDDGGEAIYKGDVNSRTQQKITDLSGDAFLILSPDDQNLAYLHLEPGTRPPFGRAYTISSDGQNKQRLMNDLVASMYWAPNGKKLALLAISRANEGPTAKIDGLALPQLQDFQLRWWIYDLETERVKPLTSFPPTNDFLQTIPFFDQYYLSLTFWSPDSRYFVVTKREDDQNNGSVWIYDTTDQEKPRKVGEGNLAVWSWR